MRVDIRIDGLEQLVDKLDRIDNVHKYEALEEGLAQGGLVAVEEAKRRVPVRSGALRDSLHVGGYTELTPEYKPAGAYGPLKGPIGKGKDKGVLIGTKLPYAQLVERGTRRMKAKPFLRPAADEKRPEIVEKVTEAIQGIIDEG